MMTFEKLWLVKEMITRLVVNQISLKDTTRFLIIEEVKETILDFSQETMKVL